MSFLRVHRSINVRNSFLIRFFRIFRCLQHFPIPLASRSINAMCLWNRSIIAVVKESLVECLLKWIELFQSSVSFPMCSTNAADVTQPDTLYVFILRSFESISSLILSF